MYSKTKTAVFAVSLLIILLTVIGCKHEYPPFEEYEVVGFVPVDSVMYGLLFVNGERLFALYDTTGHYNPGTTLGEYSLQDPTNPVLQNLESISLPPIVGFMKHQDSLAFFYHTTYGLLILNLNTLETHSLELGYHVNDIVHYEHSLVVSTYDGLRILDISNLPEYFEIFNDSIYRYDATLALRDSILLDVLLYNGPYKAKIWNIRNPENPEIICEGELPNVQYLSPGSAMTDQYVILFDYYAIRRYRHEIYDTLIYEDIIFLNQSPTNVKTSDSLIYLSSYGNGITIIRMNDFDAEQINIKVSPWNYGVISIDIFEETIYALVRKQGIYVLQRRAP